MTTPDELELISANKSFGGWLKRYKHRSKTLGCEMVFAIFLPAAAEERDVPLLWWLSGLTCTDENFTSATEPYTYGALSSFGSAAPASFKMSLARLATSASRVFQPKGWS